MAKVQKLEAFLKHDLPALRYVTPSSLNYAGLREAYITGNPAVPLAIARPKTADEVATLIKFAVSAGIDITVRTGGHDPYGRCFVQDALCIDMRDISFVHVADDKSSATLGGGTLTGDIATALAAEKLATAIGTISSVGYVGWATHGGYGPFLSSFGLGLDQILGAKLVNHEGKIVTANSEILRAIRGGGGTLGVIVELTVKVYPLEKVVLGGVIMFESTDLASTIQTFESKYREFSKQGPPEALTIQHVVANTPMGKSLALNFLWSSPNFGEGRRYVDKISALGTVLYSGVKEATIPEWMKDGEAFVSKSAYGCNVSVNVRGLTDEIIQIIARQVVKMPDDPATLFAIHGLRGSSARPNDQSVFATRRPHYLIEFIATASDAEQAKSAWSWAIQSRDVLISSDPESILPTTYISLTPPAEASLETIYNEHRDSLVEIKQRYDPKNVFKHALPNF